MLGRGVAVAGVASRRIRLVEAILQDRLRGFQSGPYRSALNGHALAGVQAAISADKERTEMRSLQGVEGFQKKAVGVES